MQEIAQLPAKTKIALFLSIATTLLFAFVFVQQAIGYNNGEKLALTPPITPPTTPTPSATPSPTPTATPSATPTPSPTATPAPSPTPTPSPVPNHAPEFKFVRGTTITVKENKKFTWTFQVTDADRDAIKVAARNLPGDLELECKNEKKYNPVTVCQIEGKVKKAGTYSANLKATDAKQASTSAAIQIIVSKK